MTRIVSFTLSDEAYRRLKDCALKADLTVSDVCRAAVQWASRAWTGTDLDGIPASLVSSLSTGKRHRIAVQFRLIDGVNALDDMASRFFLSPSTILRLAVLCWVGGRDGDADSARGMNAGLEAI